MNNELKSEFACRVGLGRKMLTKGLKKKAAQEREKKLRVETLKDVIEESRTLDLAKRVGTRS